MSARLATVVEARNVLAALVIALIATGKSNGAIAYGSAMNFSNCAD
jgi:hypothetical protein